MKTPRLSYLFAVLAVAVGPIATVAWIATQYPDLPQRPVLIGMWCAIAFWTPFAPFTFPSVILGGHRDKFQPALTPLTRSALLLPWMVLSPNSTARVATIANLAGVVAAVSYTLRFAAGLPI